MTMTATTMSRWPHRLLPAHVELSKTRLLSVCRKNSWCVAWDGDRADTRDRQTHHYSHRRPQRKHFLVPMPFHVSSKRDCGHLPNTMITKWNAIPSIIHLSYFNISCLRFCACGLKNVYNLFTYNYRKIKEFYLGCEKRLHVAHSGLIPVSFCNVSM